MLAACLPGRTGPGARVGISRFIIECNPLMHFTYFFSCGRCGCFKNIIFFDTCNAIDNVALCTATPLMAPNPKQLNSLEPFFSFFQESAAFAESGKFHQIPFLPIRLTASLR